MSDQESRATGTKFSQFGMVMNGPIDVVGLKDGKNVRATLTTDLVNTNPDVTFRDAKGRFRSTDDYSDLDNQLKVNRFIANELDALNEAIENIDFPEGADLSGYATKEQLDALAEESALTDNSLFKAIEEESTKTNVAVAALQVEINQVDKRSQEKDRDLQGQIDELAAGDVDLSPVEERLDDIEAVLPKAPAVIDPVEIGVTKTLVDSADRPSGTGKPPMENLLMWHMDAGREASGNTPGNELKTQIPNENIPNIIIDGTKEVWFKQGDRVQKWNVQNGGWFTGTNLWHLSAASTEGDDLLDGQPVEVYYIDPNSEGNDLIDAISRIESKADDRKLQAEIEQIALGLETLFKHQEDGEWTYKGELPEIPRQPGEFILATATLTSEMNSVYVQETDLNGITHNFTAPVGSYIEIVDIEDPMDYVLFEVTDEPQGSGLIQIDCKLVKAGNEFELNDRCIIRFFEVGEGLDINELDSRYLQLTGGTMKGNLAFNGNHWITYIDGEGQQYIQFKMGSSTSYTGGYNADDHIATRKRVQEAVAGLASESWVTEQIEAIDIPDVGEGYATEEYVDQKVYQSKFLPGQQVAKTDGTQGTATGSFWIIDGALYCKV